MSEPKTMIEEWDEFRAAWTELGRALARSLWIDRLAGWMADRLVRR